MATMVENGELYFFYRTRLDVDEPSGLDDIQRFYLVLAPDGGKQCRMLIVGKKRMPAIDAGSTDSEQREWLIVTAVGTGAEIGEILRPVNYETATRGERRAGEEVPAGEARYVIAEAEGTSFLLYRLHRPARPGDAQRQFGIRREAGYVIAVRNPAVKVAGFPEENPDYPARLVKKFAEERWIAVDDTALLDYPDAQLVLIGATEETFETGRRLQKATDLFARLSLDADDWPTGSLEGKSLVAPGHLPESREPRADPSRGGRKGGRRALEAASAAGVAHALKGIDFPADRRQLVRRAKLNNAGESIVQTLEELESDGFDSMADVEKALGRIR